MQVNILGTTYTVEQLDRGDDPFLAEVDGYCDKTIKRIVVAQADRENELGDFAVYQRKVLRHEIIHAFLFESGLHENFEHRTGHDETYVDWFAVQYPKLQKAFQEVGCDEP